MSGRLPVVAGGPQADASFFASHRSQDAQTTPSRERYTAADAYFRRSENSFARDFGAGWIAYTAGLSVVMAMFHGDDPQFFTNLIANAFLDPVAYATLLGFVGGDRLTIEALVKMGLLYEATAGKQIAEQMGPAWRGHTGQLRLTGPQPRPSTPATTNLPAVIRGAPPAEMATLDEIKVWNWKLREAAQSIEPTWLQVKTAEALPRLRIFGSAVMGTGVGALVGDKQLVACASGYGRRLTAAEYGPWSDACDESASNWIRSGKAVEVMAPMLAVAPILYLVSKQIPAGRAAWEQEQLAQSQRAFQAAGTESAAASRSRALVPVPARSRAEQMAFNASQRAWTGIRFFYGKSFSLARVAVRTAWFPAIVMGVAEVLRPYTEAPMLIGNLGAEHAENWKEIEARWRWHEETGWSKDLPDVCATGAAMYRNRLPLCGGSTRTIDDAMAAMVASGRRYRTARIQFDAKKYFEWREYVNRFQNAYATSFLMNSAMVEEVNAHRALVLDRPRGEDRREPEVPIALSPLYRGLSAHDVGIPDPVYVTTLLGIKTLENVARADSRSSISAIQQAAEYIEKTLDAGSSGSHSLTAAERIQLESILRGFRARLNPNPPQEALDLLAAAEASGNWNLQERTAVIEAVRSQLAQNSVASLFSALSAINQTLVTDPSRSGRDHPYRRIREILGTSAPLPTGVAALTAINRRLEGATRDDHPAKVGRVATPTMADYVLASAVCGPEASPAEDSQLARVGLIDRQDPGYQYLPIWNSAQLVMQLSGWGAYFRPPRLVSAEHANVCETTPAKPVIAGSLGGAPLFDIHRSKWVVGGAEYEGLLDVFRKRLRVDVAGAPDFGAKPFTEWWKGQVDPAATRALERMNERYAEIVDKEIFPALSGRPMQLTYLDRTVEFARGQINRLFGERSWERPGVPVTRTYIAGRTGHELQDSLIGSLKQDVYRWLNLTRRSMIGGLPIPLPNLRMSPGLNLTQEVELRITKLQRYFDVAFKMFQGPQQMREALAEYETLNLAKSRTDLIEDLKEAKAAEEAQLQNARSVPNPARVAELETKIAQLAGALTDVEHLPEPAISEMDWFHIQRVSSRGAFRARLAFLSLMMAARSQAESIASALEGEATFADRRAQEASLILLRSRLPEKAAAEAGAPSDNGAPAATDAVDTADGPARPPRVQAGPLDGQTLAEMERMKTELPKVVRRTWIGQYAAINVANIAEEMKGLFEMVTLVKTDMLGER